MIKKIEEPDWIAFDSPLDVAAWFKQEVYPINKALDEAVEVSCYQDSEGWCAYNNCTSFENKYTHKALLINIEPIKQETCADVFEDWVKQLKKSGIPYSFEKKIIERYERAKAALQRTEQ